MGMGMMYAKEPRMLRILCADQLEDRAILQLRASGHDVVSRPDVSGEGLVAALIEVEPNLLVVRSTKVPAAALAATSALELVVRAGAWVQV